MCTPAAALVMQGAGAGSQALGAYFGAQSQKTQLAGQADIADINARMLEGSAQQTLLTGQREEQKAMLATAQLKGRERAALAANGVDLGAGSAANVLTSTDTLGEIDANTINANAVRSAWGYRVQATNQTNQAAQDRAAANAINPNAAAMGSLLTSAGQVASSWYQFNKGGLTTTPDYNAIARRAGVH